MSLHNINNISLPVRTFARTYVRTDIFLSLKTNKDMVVKILLSFFFKIDVTYYYFNISY